MRLAILVGLFCLVGAPAVAGEGFFARARDRRESRRAPVQEMVVQEKVPVVVTVEKTFRQVGQKVTVTPAKVEKVESKSSK